MHNRGHATASNERPLTDGVFSTSADRSWPAGARGVGGDRERVLPTPSRPQSTSALRHQARDTVTDR